MPWGQFNRSITQHYFSENGRAVCGAYYAADIREIRISDAKRCAACTKILTRRLQAARCKLHDAETALRP